MIDIRTGKDVKDFSILEEPKIYIYVMLNDSGKVKIGKTKDIQQRYQSLCGSNAGGNKIIKLYCSSSTYLHSLENIMHDKFVKYRVPKTEWFYDKDESTGELLFNKVISELQLLFSSASYNRCNSLRKSLDEKNK